MDRIYHNPQCSTAREALKTLQAAGRDPEVINYLETPPSREELTRLIAAAGLSVREAVRTREPAYTEAGLSAASSDDELLDAMLETPRLIQRPIVVTDKGVRIPRPMSLLDEIL